MYFVDLSSDSYKEIASVNENQTFMKKCEFFAFGGESVCDPDIELLPYNSIRYGVHHREGIGNSYTDFVDGFGSVVAIYKVLEYRIAKFD